MQKAYYYTNSYNNPQFDYRNSDERFIWPLVPFIGGALVGYIAGRPQYNYPYYPVYYPYYQNYYQPYYSYTSYRSK